MKTCISRLITFINHLFANVVSTFVERWLNRHLDMVILVHEDRIVARVNGAGDYGMFLDITRYPHVYIAACERQNSNGMEEQIISKED